MKCLICNTCNKELRSYADQKLHYRSDWHCYNMKRQVAGVPGVTEALFLARQAAIVQERAKAKQAPMLYCCGLCCKEYRSPNAYAQHLKSRGHTIRASSGTNIQEAIIKHRPSHVSPPFPQSKQQHHNHHRRPISNLEEEGEEEEDEESEWEEVGPDEVAAAAAAELGAKNKGDDDDDDEMMMDPSCCFMCDEEHDSVESCMAHMHKQHGLFIPDSEYLIDPVGFLTILSLKVRRDFQCLYCSDDCYPFPTLEAVRNHMDAKGHCKVHFGDGGSEEEAELEEFYDYSSSYVDENGRQLVAASGDGAYNVELGTGGSEMLIRRILDGKVYLTIIGCREFMRFYRQRPRRSTKSNAFLAGITSATSSHKSVGLVTSGRERREHQRATEFRKMEKLAPEAHRTRIGFKNNVIRNLPRNVPY